MLIALTARAVAATVAFLVLCWGRFAVIGPAGSLHPMAALGLDLLVADRVTGNPEARPNCRAIVVGIDGT